MRKSSLYEDIKVLYKDEKRLDVLELISIIGMLEKRIEEVKNDYRERERLRSKIPSRYEGI